MRAISDVVKPGVVSGADMKYILDYAKTEGFAIPAVNIVDSNTINAVLETARVVNSPVFIQITEEGARFYAGLGLMYSDSDSLVLGAVAAARHVHLMAQAYGVRVILQTNRISRGSLHWVDGLLLADEKYFQENGKPLFSSHAFDLSDEPFSRNMEVLKRYFEQMGKLGQFLEAEAAYSCNSDGNTIFIQPDCINKFYEVLHPISSNFLVSVTLAVNYFETIRGQNNSLSENLKSSQEYIQMKQGLFDHNPVRFALYWKKNLPFEEFVKTKGLGVVKINIDTYTDWAEWDGIRKYEFLNHDHLQSEKGCVEAKNGKVIKLYDPRLWLRRSQESVVVRLKQVYNDFDCVNRN